ncbi:hypothetical protein [Methylobacterium dankookense]|uniref:Uncharacterized protein n=1 Tax=Methylobacterium dankookense TaxID=560405 RepID=A0A564FTE5_9HYPH|nr:hypothetical protein [Methylobacterium dankookense]GJD55232.1 hypothetical protein IFDJLNFL_1116 [Methylobacterium dankookense]VUF11312.1 hypothetical protein MTDSW087_00992 [Methylobacterium dankookense]
MRSVLLALPVTLSLTAMAAAQAPTPPGTPTPAAPAPGAAGVGTPTTGATGSPGAATYSPSGRPADTMSNDSSAAGNANQPSQTAPQGGGGR